MKPVKTIKLKGLMASNGAKAIFAALGEGQVRFVGGCVRNALLGEEVSDIDIATLWAPEDTMAKLKRAGIRVIPTGIDHGTVTAVIDGKPYEITTLRKDVDTDGRRAVVAYTDDWTEDAKRRDFTFNTLLADERGKIYDPLGRGVSDLEKRKVVFVGDPATRIREDYLRILRFFRFHARYGKGKPEAKGLAACAKLSGGLKFLSKERVTQEVLKILSGPEPQILEMMVKNGILKSLVHPKAQLHFLASPLIQSAESGLLVLGNFSKSGMARIEKQLRLSNKQLKLLTESVFYVGKFKKISDHDLKVLLYKSGREVTELVLVSRLLLSGATAAQAKKWIEKLRDMERPVLPLRGQDLINQGMKPGPDIKKALDRFERSWIKNNFKN